MPPKRGRPKHNEAASSKATKKAKTAISSEATTTTIAPTKRGPGRPKKTDTVGLVRRRNVTFATRATRASTTRPKRLVVRPARLTYPISSTVAAIKRVRGRPKKSDLFAPAVKAGRGRPKSGAIGPITKKRGPGRPKKSGAVGRVTKKKGPGRPEESVTKVTTKAGPGRPRKIAIPKPPSRKLLAGVGRPSNAEIENKPPINLAPTQLLDIYVFGSGKNSELGLGHMKRDGKKPTEVRRPRLNDLLDSKKVGIVQMDVGGMHCIALSSRNQIITWGVNDNGALGRQTTWKATKRDVDAESESASEDSGLNPKECTPTAIPASSFAKGVKFVQVAATDSASFALTQDGLVYGWGTFTGSNGVIGFSKLSVAAGKLMEPRPLLIPGLTNIKILAAGGNHVQALDHKGNVYSWGNGSQNQLGRTVMDSYRLQALSPSQFGLPKGRIVHISSGPSHSFAIDSHDNVYAWGLSNFGQTGIAKGAGEGNAVIKKPTKVHALAQYKIKEIKGGNHHSVACTEDGELLFWGRCDDGQAGVEISSLPAADLIFDDRDKARILMTPTVVKDSDGNGIKAVSVAAGIDDSIALTNNGQAYAWGFSANYRTGLGTEDPVKEATKIKNSAVRGKKLTFAACGGQFSVLAGPTTG